MMSNSWPLLEDHVTGEPLIGVDGVGHSSTSVEAVPAGAGAGDRLACGVAPGGRRVMPPLGRSG